MSKRKGDWAQTYMGKQFWPLDPRPEEVDIRDIAHSLANTCRFNGHCNEFYSVAQHSYLVSNIVNPQNALAALLHDASEAYTGDLIQPIKKNLREFSEIEEKVQEAVFEHFNIKKWDHDQIVKADMILLFTEMRDLMKKPPKKWDHSDKYKPLDEKIIPLTPRKAETLFLGRYNELKER